jgi:hypothetical protein
MPSNNDFLSSINKISNFFGLTEKRLRTFADGFGRGSFWLVLWGLVIAFPLFIGYFILPQTPLSSIDDFARTVAATLLQSAGGQSTFTAVGGILENSKFFLDAALRPTALTLILAIVAYRRGRTRQTIETTDKGSESTGLAYAMGLGSGFATLATLATFLFSGIVSNTGLLRTETASPLTWISMVLVIGVPAWLGALRETGSKRATSAWRWFYAAIRTFAVTYAALIIATLIVIWLYFLIAPVFAMSTPDVEPISAAKLTEEQTRTILLTILAVLLVLPSILFFSLSFGMGANIGIQTEIQGVNIFDAISTFIPTDFLSGISNFNLQSTFGWPTYACSIALVAHVALVAGAAAAHKTKSNLNFKRHFVVTLVATVLSAGVLTYLTSLSLTWSNHGQSNENLTEGALALQTGFFTYGVSAASLAFICGLIAVFATLGASTAQAFTSAAFPRVLSWLTFGRSTHAEPRPLGPVLFGTAVTVAIIALAAVPVGIATVERAWASADSPANKFDDVAKLLNDGKLAEVKKTFQNENTADRAWLPDKVLESARPTSSMNKSITVTDFNENSWQIGELDAIGLVSWKVSEDDSIKLTLTADGKVKENFEQITHADYKVRQPYQTFSVAAGEFLSPTGKANLKVNGEKVVAGNYNAIPGAYVVTTDAYKLVAASKKTVATISAEDKYVAKEKPNLKPEYEKILDTEINRLAKECSKFSAIEKANCFTLGQIYNNRTGSQKKAPSEFFGFQTDSFKVIDFACEGEPEDKLLSALHVERERICEIQMTFTLDYFKSKSEVRQLSRQETYNGCPAFEDAVCTRSRTISLGSETVEVRGDKIGSAQFTSAVPFIVSAMGYLDAKDKFSIVKQFVKPTYETVKEVVVKPVKKSFVLLGYYVNLDELKYVVKSPKVGDAYAVTAARIIYVWSGKQWLELETAK